MEFFKIRKDIPFMRYAMSKPRDWLVRWGPSALCMAAIFALSSRPSSELPHFGAMDRLIKKSGHMLGYGLLALSYWRGFRWQRGKILHAWGLAIAYAAPDELHQGLVPGRQASVVDVLLFDAVGAALMLWLRRWHSRQEPDPPTAA